MQVLPLLHHARLAFIGAAAAIEMGIEWGLAFHREEDGDLQVDLLPTLHREVEAQEGDGVDEQAGESLFDMYIMINCVRVWQVSHSKCQYLCKQYSSQCIQNVQ